MTGGEVTCLWEIGAVLGEGALWDARDNCVWSVDIKKPQIYWLDLGTGARTSWTPPCATTALGPRAAGGFIAATARGFALVDPRAGRFELLGPPEPDRPHNRSNDGNLDALGRFWAGTMDDRDDAREPTGALYRLDRSGEWLRMDDGYMVPNGPVFSPDGATLYHNDSGRQLTYAFDLAPDGSLSNRRVFIQHRDGYPDGMTIDASGHLWIAMWDGWAVRRFAPDGRQAGAVRMPVARPTRPAFGGAALDRLFVTSSSIDAGADQPQAGGLFEIAAPGTAGLPIMPFAG